VPTDEDWTTLTTFYGGESLAGGALKETGTIFGEVRTTQPMKADLRVVPAAFVTWSEDSIMQGTTLIGGQRQRS